MWKAAITSAFILLAGMAQAQAVKRGCPIGNDGHPRIDGPVRCLEPFQKDLLGIGKPSGELARHERNARRLMRKYPVATQTGKARCPIGNDGHPRVDGPVRCLEPFQRDLLGIGKPSGELARHERNARRLIQMYGH